MAQAAVANTDTGVSFADEELTRLVTKARAFSVEFPAFLANHLPMVLVALRRMGASDERLAEFFEFYRVTNKLVPVPPPVAPIEQALWTESLGDRTREGDYRAFFLGEIERLGLNATIDTYLPTLVPGIAASALHALMRLAYGALTANTAEIGTALGYWAATYLRLAEPSGAPPITDDPAAVLLRIRDYPTFRNVEVELDLLWHFMRSMAAKPEFKPVVDWLDIVPGTHDRIAKASLALMAGTMDFCAVHAVTGTHWIRILNGYWPNHDLALRYFWTAIASLYPKIGFPDLPSADQLDAWRRADCPEWPDIFAKAVQSNDEHDLSFTFSAQQEWEFYGDPLYRFVAARRVGLIP
jgi:hypothetical protein